VVGKKRTNTSVFTAPAIGFKLIEEVYVPPVLVLTWKPAGAVTVTGFVSEVAVTAKFIDAEAVLMVWLPKLKEVGVAATVGGPTVPVPFNTIFGELTTSIPLMSVTAAFTFPLITLGGLLGTNRK